MGAARGRGLHPGGIVRTVGRLALLVGLGFGAGLVIGILSEEPELLAGHLRGESEWVLLGARGEPGGEGDVDESAADAERSGRGETLAATPIDDAARDGDEALAVAAPGETDPRDRREQRLALLDEGEDAGHPGAVRPGVAAAPRAPTGRATALVRGGSSSKEENGRWAIQVGAFSDPKAASGLVQSLQSKGYPVELIPATKDSPRWRVRVQPVASRARAEDLADRLKREERLPTWLISLEAGAGS